MVSINAVARRAVRILADFVRTQFKPVKSVNVYVKTRFEYGLRACKVTVNGILNADSISSRRVRIISACVNFNVICGNGRYFPRFFVGCGYRNSG